MAYFISNFFFFFLMIRRPPRSTRQSTLLPSRRSSDLKLEDVLVRPADPLAPVGELLAALVHWRSEEHTSELQSLTDISYAVFSLKKKKKGKEEETVKGKEGDREKGKEEKKT